MDMEVRLVVEKGGKKKKNIRLKSEETILGRRQDCDLRIPSEEVSRRHALISVHDGRVTVEDLDSVNGTYVNEHRISGKQLLMPGDRLEVGPVQFVVEFEMTQTMLDGARDYDKLPGRGGFEADEDGVVLLPADDDESFDVLPLAGAEEEEENPLDMLEVVEDDPATFLPPPVVKASSRLPSRPAKAAKPAKPAKPDDDAPIPVENDLEGIEDWRMPRGAEADMRNLLSGMEDRPKSRQRDGD